MCALAARYRLPVLYDIYRQPVRIEMLAGQYPEVTSSRTSVVSATTGWSHRQVIDQVVRHRNVFADTSGFRYFDRLADAARRAREAHLLGGAGCVEPG